MRTPIAPTLALAALLVPALAAAQSKEKKRLEACREVLEELLGGEERIPRDLLDKAECVAVVPSAKKFALGVGGRWGKGAVVCRGRAGSAPWGAPLLISVGGGSFGLQIGGQEADYVFLVMNPKGIDYLMRSQFTLGGDAAVAAGPVGRTGSAGTDLRMRAEILSYSRSRGLFAGLSLEGSVVKQDKDGNENVYGERVDPKRVLLEGAYPVPESARGLVELLETSSPRHAP
ncbi:MAG TPA: lipid-binding SYLF domain-containing protein [Vicinamibacteria bacterium]|nr:lipid-binding SYLF domain-containing protein [Vicinamibacteria bacterium]